MMWDLSVPSSMISVFTFKIAGHKLSYGIFRWEPAIAVHDWFFAPIRMSSDKIVPNLFGPPWEVIPTSPCTRIDRTASGLTNMTNGSFLPVPCGNSLSLWLPNVSLAIFVNSLPLYAKRMLQHLSLFIYSQVHYAPQQL